MRIKKWLLLGAALFTVASLGLAGCGNQSADNAGANGQPLKVGTNADFAPFEFQGPNGSYDGFDMDLIRAVAKEMGTTADIQNITFDGLIPALAAHNIDVAISGMSINDERKKNVLFSEPYYKSGLTIAVRKNETNIKNFKDLAGKTVAVQIGTTSAAEVEKDPQIHVKELQSSADTFLELKNGGVDAVVNDKPVNAYYLKLSGDTDVRILNDTLTSEEYGIAMAKDDTALQKKVNDALDALKKNGEYDKIYEKWFGAQKD